jgi:AcrR family transcriptional regulator
MSKKLNQILKIGKELFYKYGIKRVSIEEICKEASVSKMTFYKFFDNKIDLVRRIYELETVRAMKIYRTIMDSDLPFVEKVKKSIDLKREQTENLSEEFYNDILKSDNPELKEMFNNALHKNMKIILNDYIKAQKEGEIRKDIKPEFIMFFMNHMMEMAQDPRLASLYSTPNEMIMELNNFFFYGVLPRNN